MNKDKKVLRRITVDLDTKSKKAFRHAEKTLFVQTAMGFPIATPTKRGWHFSAFAVCSWWEACCIRFIAGDDRKRLYLDLVNDTKPHNVLFHEKKRVKVKP